MNSIYQVMPDLTADEYTELKADIESRGVMVPIEFDEHGNVLDGHHRLRACQELGIKDYPKVIRAGMSEDEKYKHAFQLNVARRHLSRDQAKAVRADYMTRHPELSDREIAKTFGVSNSTVSLQRKKLEDGGQVCESHTSTGADGKQYPRRHRPVTIFNPSPREEKAIRDPEVIERMADGRLAAVTVAKKLELEQAEKSIAAQFQADANAPVLFVGDSVGLRTPEKVDLLLTDPPYSTDVANISKFARSWLPAALDNVKDTGSAYVFIGAYPEEVFEYLGTPIPKHMKLSQILIWTYKNTLGNVSRNKYKPNYQTVLFYRGVNAPPLDCPVTNELWAVQEVNAPDGRQGDRYHAWQKPMELAERFIRHSTQPGMTVYDPFACTGTFLLAAAKLGRRAFGYEIDETNAAIAFERGCVRGQ